MNTTSNHLIKTLAVLSCFLSLQSFAQKEGGNGGDPNEVAEFAGLNGQHLDSWYNVKQDLIVGLELDRHHELKLAAVNTEQFKEKFISAIKTAKIKWDDVKIVVDGVERSCENYIDSKRVNRIHCNQTFYASAMKNYDAETQYKFIAHEYLSLAGFEHNAYGVSDYPISSQISASLRTVQVKRWGLKVAHDSIDDLVLTDREQYSTSTADNCVPNQLNNDFLLAVCLRNFDAVKAYVLAGGNINVQAHDWFYAGDSALTIAVRENYPEIVDFLIEHHINLDLQTDLNEATGMAYRGATALFLAANSGYLDLVNKLIAAGANVNLRDCWNYSPMSQATSRGFYSVMKALFKAKAKLNGGRSVFREAISRDEVDLARFFIHAGANINAQDQFGDSALLYAIRSSKNLKMIKMLIAENIDLEIQGGYHPDQNRPTALIDAASTGFLEAVKLLIEAGADRNAVDEDHLDARGRALKNGHTDVVNYLDSL